MSTIALPNSCRPSLQPLFTSDNCFEYPALHFAISGPQIHHPIRHRGRGLHSAAGREAPQLRSRAGFRAYTLGAARPYGSCRHRTNTSPSRDAMRLPRGCALLRRHCASLTEGDERAECTNQYRSDAPECAA